jgi:hypothetical protein
MTLRDRINATDFDTATPNDIAILLEQVFLHHDDRCRDGGPMIVAQGVIKQFEESVRRRAAPELHEKVKGRCAELRSTLGQLDDVFRKLERDNAQTRP